MLSVVSIIGDIPSLHDAYVVLTSCHIVLYEYSSSEEVYAKSICIIKWKFPEAAGKIFCSTTQYYFFLLAGNNDRYSFGVWIHYWK